MKVKGLLMAETNWAAGWSSSSTFKKITLTKENQSLRLNKIQPVEVDMYIIYIIFNVSCLCGFKNPAFFRMEWVRYGEWEFPYHKSTECDGGLSFSHKLLSDPGHKN